MRPLLHPTLVNGRYGDPALYVETLFENRAVLFDLGEITALPPRKILRIEHVFISHAHIDHFIGFDHLLRLLVGREKTVRLYGPSGLSDHVGHKLKGYCWNLVDGYSCDLVFLVTEINSPSSVSTTRYRLKHAFAPEPISSSAAFDGVLYREPTFSVSVAIFDHHMPCLGFALQEAVHVNVWKNRVTERRLDVGPWVRALKRAVVEGRPDDYSVEVGGRAREPGMALPLGSLRDLISVTAGQKIAYVTDVADSASNRAAITMLARDADILFIEAAFARADAALAAQRAHLTTTAAGEIARAANVRRVEPFQFSARYAGEEQRMLDEVGAAFAGGRS
jgi:ribonuclease Z